MAKSPQIKVMRQLAMLKAREHQNRLIGLHNVTYRFFVADNRRRDEVNMMQQCKPYIDGVVDAMIIEDDRWQLHRICLVSVEIDKENPRVELTFTGSQIGPKERPSAQIEDLDPNPIQTRQTRSQGPRKGKTR